MTGPELSEAFRMSSDFRDKMWVSWGITVECDVTATVAIFCYVGDRPTKTLSHATTDDRNNQTTQDILNVVIIIIIIIHNHVLSLVVAQQQLNNSHRCLLCGLSFSSLCVYLSLSHPELQIPTTL